MVDSTYKERWSGKHTNTNNLNTQSRSLYYDPSETLHKFEFADLGPSKLQLRYEYFRQSLFFICSQFLQLRVFSNLILLFHPLDLNSLTASALVRRRVKINIRVPTYFEYLFRTLCRIFHHSYYLVLTVLNVTSKLQFLICSLDFRLSIFSRSLIIFNLGHQNFPFSCHPSNAYYFKIGRNQLSINFVNLLLFSNNYYF